jgi:hypothetical protein
MAAVGVLAGHFLWARGATGGFQLHGVLMFSNSARVSIGRNTGTSDVSDAAPNRCARALSLRLVEPRLCSANIGIARHNLHIFCYIQNATMLSVVDGQLALRRRHDGRSCRTDLENMLTSHNHLVTHLRLLGTEWESTYLPFLPEDMPQ